MSAAVSPCQAGLRHTDTRSHAAIDVPAIGNVIDVAEDAQMADPHPRAGRGHAHRRQVGGVGLRVLQISSYAVGASNETTRPSIQSSSSLSQLEKMISCRPCRSTLVGRGGPPVGHVLAADREGRLAGRQVEPALESPPALSQLERERAARLSHFDRTLDGQIADPMEAESIGIGSGCDRTAACSRLLRSAGVVGREIGNQLRVWGGAARSASTCCHCS